MKTDLLEKGGNGALELVDHEYLVLAESGHLFPGLGKVDELGQDTGHCGLELGGLALVKAGARVGGQTVEMGPPEKREYW